jgi:hypothetical protein
LRFIGEIAMKNAFDKHRLSPDSLVSANARSFTLWAFSFVGYSAACARRWSTALARAAAASRLLVVAGAAATGARARRGRVFTSSCMGS